jgi:uncharacterized protein YjdB
VDSTGLVTAVSSGTAIITATAADGSGPTGTLSVTVAIPATGIVVTSASGTTITTSGGTLHLVATVVPSGAVNPGVTWSSGTPAVATVDSTGLVTAVGNGTTTITATAADGSGLTGTLSVTVAISATGIVVTSASGTTITTNGGTLQLVATVVPPGAGNPGFTWSSGSPAVATVNSAGLVTAVSNGTTTITATAADGSGLTGTLSVTVAIPVVYFVAQANGTTTATLAGGTFSVDGTYAVSGNAFKYVAPNYYGTVSNGFIYFPTPMSGDFSIVADVTITTQNKANNACGIGLGITTGFTGTDSYAYIVMRNSLNVANALYVNGATTVSAGSPTVAFTNGTALELTFSRSGSYLTYGAGPVGGTATTNTANTSLFTNGTTVYGSGAVYPAISFNNVAATITNLVIKDGNGNTVYNSATGILLPHP